MINVEPAATLRKGLAHVLLARLELPPVQVPPSVSLALLGSTQM